MKPQTCTVPVFTQDALRGAGAEGGVQTQGSSSIPQDSTATLSLSLALPLLALAVPPAVPQASGTAAVQAQGWAWGLRAGLALGLLLPTLWGPGARCGGPGWGQGREGERRPGALHPSSDPWGDTHWGSPGWAWKWLREGKGDQGQKLGQGAGGCKVTGGLGPRNTVSERAGVPGSRRAGAGGGDASPAQPRTGTGSAAPRAHTIGCMDSRLTSGSRHSGQGAGRPEPCRRAAPLGTCSCGRPPGAGCPGPSCGPGRLCTHSAPVARSRRPAPVSLRGGGPPARCWPLGPHPRPTRAPLSCPEAGLGGLGAPHTLGAAAAGLAGRAVLASRLLLQV